MIFKHFHFHCLLLPSTAGSMQEVTHYILVDSSTVTCWDVFICHFRGSGSFVAFILFLMENPDSKH